jgi:hypothetical protein
MALTHPKRGRTGLAYFLTYSLWHESAADGVRWFWEVVWATDHDGDPEITAAGGIEANRAAAQAAIDATMKAEG